MRTNRAASNFLNPLNPAHSGGSMPLFLMIPLFLTACIDGADDSTTDPLDADGDGYELWEDSEGEIPSDGTDCDDRDPDFHPDRVRASADTLPPVVFSGDGALQDAINYVITSDGAYIELCGFTGSGTIDPVSLTTDVAPRILIEDGPGAAFSTVTLTVTDVPSLVLNGLGEHDIVEDRFTRWTLTSNNEEIILDGGILLGATLNSRLVSLGYLEVETNIMAAGSTELELRAMNFNGSTALSLMEAATSTGQYLRFSGEAGCNIITDGGACETEDNNIKSFSCAATDATCTIEPVRF